MNELPQKNAKGEGRIIAGKYEFLEKLGGGGMGVVYRARHILLGADVALKLLAGGRTLTPEKRRRFLTEARAAQAFSHRHAVAVREVGEEADGTLWLAMDFSSGESLRKRLERLGRLPLEDAVIIILQVLGALHEAHRVSIVHRDLKPENILVEMREGRPFAKVVDFGLARFMKNAGLGAYSTTIPGAETPDGALLGTVDYMSPEQAAGEKVDFRTDIYASGVILYEMLSGRMPVVGESIPKRLTSIMFRQPLSISEVCPEANVPFEVDAVLRKAMAKDPNERFPDAKSFQKALRLAVQDYLAPELLEIGEIPTLDELSSRRLGDYISESKLAVPLPTPPAALSPPEALPERRLLPDSAPFAAPSWMQTESSRFSTAAPWVISVFLAVFIVVIIGYHYFYSMRPESRAEKLLVFADQAAEKAVAASEGKRMGETAAMREREVSALRDALALTEPDSSRRSEIESRLKRAEPEMLAAGVLWRLERFAETNQQSYCQTAGEQFERLKHDYPDFRPEVLREIAGYYEGYSLCRQAYVKVRNREYEEARRLYRRAYDVLASADVQMPSVYADDYRRVNLAVTIQEARFRAETGDFHGAAGKYEAATGLAGNEKTAAEYRRQAERNRRRWVEADLIKAKKQLDAADYDAAEKILKKLQPSADKQQRAKIVEMAAALNKERIKKITAKALADFDEGDYKVALALFSEVVDKADDETLRAEAADYAERCRAGLAEAKELYSRATAAGRTNPMLALDAFQELLARYPHVPQAADAEKEIKKIRKYLAANPGLVVLSEPKYADVFLKAPGDEESKLTGITPLHYLFPSETLGVYELLIRHEGYRDKQVKFERKGREESLPPFDVVLEPVTGSARVICNRQKAVVTLDKQVTPGESPEVFKKAAGEDGAAVFKGIPTGKYSVEAEAGAYRSDATELVVKEGEAIELALEMKLRPAKLDISSTPSGLAVFLDGKPCGRTPNEVAVLTGGRHVVDLRDTEGFSVRRVVTLEAGKHRALEKVDFEEAVREQRRAWKAMQKKLSDPAYPVEHHAYVMSEYLHKFPNGYHSEQIAGQLEKILAGAWNKAGGMRSLLSAARAYLMMSVRRDIEEEVRERLGSIIMRPVIFKPNQPASRHLVPLFSGTDRKQVYRFGESGLEALAVGGARQRNVAGIDSGKILNVMPFTTDFGRYAVVDFEGPFDDIVSLDTRKAVLRVPSETVPVENGRLHIKAVIRGRHVRGELRMRRAENRPETLFNKKVASEFDDIRILPGKGRRILQIVNVHLPAGGFEVTILFSPAPNQPAVESLHRSGFQSPLEVRACSDDGNVVITGGKKKGLLLLGLEPLRALYIFAGPYKDVALSGSGGYLAVSTDAGLTIIDSTAPTQAIRNPAATEIVGFATGSDCLVMRNPYSRMVSVYYLSENRTEDIVSGEVLAFIPSRGCLLVAEKQSQIIYLVDILAGKVKARLDINRLRPEVAGLPVDFWPTAAVIDERLGPVAFLGTDGTVWLCDLLAPAGLTEKEAALYDKTCRFAGIKVTAR